ncbi:MAG: dihydrofolate reductase [Devosia sp.]|uniref:dihydrofolate reductase family protein n=1 Tax=Devosia sp. 66-22 TaxID=1895753 RepID=UPI00092A35CB|nr:dihydrofolate reductase family protein [Devosia sp. 66-22]MBN9347781.1 dihydrofolate reductase [Devosia sp.]OJX50357.1 MAG: dihydrofolate reductase [Devosia sp. 66-22]
MARIVGYIAASLDGFIADENEGLDWLYKAEAELGEHHYDRFIEGIRTIVMGRSTYDWLARSGMDWPYGRQRVLVVTSRPIENPVGALETRSDIDALIAELRGLSDGDVWMLGGGTLQMAFIERDALDEIEVYLASAIIGGGSPLFPPTGHKATLRLLSAKSLGPGMARLHYSFR